MRDHLGSHAMSEDFAVQVERVLHRRVLHWRPVLGGGWSVARRGIFVLEGGQSVFAKMGAEADTAAAISSECAVYPLLAGPFVPRLLGADPDVPILIIEDLSAAEWPPPWTPQRLAGLHDLFGQLAATVADPRLPALASRLGEWGAWESVEADPAPLVGAAVVDLPWLERHLPALLHAQRRAGTAGDRLLHLDVRSDNLCFRDGHALLVDWNHAVRGDPRWDRLLMLQNVELEGGPAAAEQAPDADPGIVAWLAGFFAARVGLPPPQGAPRVRGFQLAQLEVVLPWCCRLLGIPPPVR
jgi:hypothetical protein